MADLIWRLIERRLRRRIPSAQLASVLGDLAEDYVAARSARGHIRAWVWLLREMRSLSRAYTAPSRQNSGRLMLADDLRHACRRLIARPASPVLCAGLLALGIGLATTMFSVVDSLLLEPAPFRDGDRLVRQGLWRPAPALMDAWRTSGMFEAVEAAQLATFRTDDEDAAGWAGANVTPGVFDLLGVRALRGRVFDEDDARPGSDDVVLLSEKIWRGTFAGDSTLLGRRINVNDIPVRVVGIMPDTFRFPTPATVAWRPFDPSLTDTGATTVFGRLAAGVPLPDANARAVPLAIEFGRLPRNYMPGSAPPLHHVGRAELGTFTTRALWMLLAGAVLVFVVLCANVGSLLLANLSARRREFGMCAALGASRMRLLRTAAAEHAIVAVAGVAGGIGLAAVLTSAVPEFFVGHTLNVIDIDLRALLTACGLGIAAVFLCGLAPAWAGTGNDPIDALRVSGQASTDTRAATLMNRGLLVGEVALACSLLVGSVLLVRSFANLVQTDRGISIDGIIRVRVGGMDDAFGSGEAMALGAEAIERRFAAWPVIDRVALSRELPPGAGNDGLVHLGAPGTRPDPDTAISTDIYRVGAPFFDLHDIPILRGRTFMPGDAESDVIVGERLAALLWPGENPVGRTFAVGNLRPAHRVIGVAGEIRLPTLDASLDRPELYAPLGRRSRTLYVNFRCRAICPPEADVRAQVLAVHPALHPRLTSASEDAYASHLRLPRATAEVAGLFAIVAVLTAAGGLFAVLTHAVGRRRREFGIRSALGASPARMRTLILRDAMSIAAAGVALGALGGWIVARSLAAFQYGVTTTDPVTWAGVLITLALTCIAAAWRPARQAMRVDPVKLLRED